MRRRQQVGWCPSALDVLRAQVYLRGFRPSSGQDASRTIAFALSMTEATKVPDHPRFDMRRHLAEVVDLARAKGWAR